MLELKNYLLLIKIFPLYKYPTFQKRFLWVMFAYLVPPRSSRIFSAN
jgi:hypothetical protein